MMGHLLVSAITSTGQVLIAASRSTSARSTKRSPALLTGS
jgi:hypothetical protein